MKYKSTRNNNYEFDLERVTVFLGANGSGKSKLLVEIKDGMHSIRVGSKPIYIEGGRTITLKDVLQYDHSNFQQFERLDSALAIYEGKKNQSLASRVFDALVVLEKKEQHLKSQHSDQVEKWNTGGRVGDYPKRRKRCHDPVYSNS
jgi:energy-coupling factor transporter ATP-binding protein EcfA2